jgi:class 3 adenylate cyclase/alpha-beta hydrolase superfamily lysophospholipase
MVDTPIRYATARDGVQIAYRILGSGPIDVVWVNGFASNLDMNDRSPLFGDFANRLPRVARVLEFDKRGSGLSDHTFGSGTMEDRIDDIRAVMDAAGFGRAALQGAADGGPIALTFTATYPERVSSIVLHGSWARITWAPDYPIGVPPSAIEPILQFVEESWGSGDVLAMFVGKTLDATDRAILARVERSQGTPKHVASQLRIDIELDVRDTLPLIAVPTLVLQSPDGTSTFPAALGRYLVDHIEGARCVDVPELWDSDEAVDAVEEFLTGLPGGAVSSTDRVLATVLFTDIVGSTDRAGQLGDAAWRRLLDAHDDLVRAELARFGGREVDTTGDGFFATFDGPARALRCAAAIVEAVRTIGLEIRAGVHTGEVTRRGDGYAGMGVHIGARVMAVAGASEVVTTSTVRDLVIGSGLEFADRGVHTLKGVQGSWQLLTLRT